ncbi:MAG: GAF domain-containing protein [Chloroflexota bacterium]|nr:GAF domain-containing protein [Chloroflexota bacterium]
MGDKERLLVVDDDEGTCKILSLVFERQGYEIETAGTGREAIIKAQERFFNLALLDINLPDVEGVELLATLKEMHPDTAVIMITAYASLETAVQALNEGASAYITKPLNVAEVLATVGEALEKQGLVIENRGLYQEAQRELAERKRAEEEIRQRTAQLEALRQVGLEITAQLDLDALLRSIVSQAAELVEGLGGGVYIYRPERDVLEWVVAVGPTAMPVGSVLYRGEGLAGKVWEAGEPLIVDDYQRWEGRASVYEGLSNEAIVGVPICWGEEFLGVLNVEDAHTRTFSPADAELLSLFATQAAIAIRNACLFQETQQALGEMEALYRASSAVGKATSIEEVVRGVAEGAASLGLSFCSLSLIPTADGNGMPLRADTYGVHLTDNGWAAVPSVTDAPITDQATAHRLLEDPDFLLIYTDTDDPQEEKAIPEHTRETMRNAGIRGLVITGLNLRGRSVGLLNFGSTNSLRGLPEDHVRQMRTYANQVAVAVENRLLFNSLNQEKERLALLYRLSHHLSESLEVYDVAQRALDDICAVLGATSGVFLVYEPGNDHLRLVAVSGYDAESVEILNLQIRLRLGDGLAGWVAMQQLPVLVNGVNEDERWLPVTGIDDWVHAVLSVPLVNRDELVGVFSIYSDQVGFFGQDHLRLAESAAATVAAAIANARLFEAEQRRRREAETLREASLALTIALDRDEVIELILAQLQKVVPYDSASVQLFKDGRLEIVGGRGFPNLPDLLGISFPVDGDNPNSEVVRADAPFIVEDAPAVYGEFRSEPHAQASIRAWLGVPMLVGERLVGMIALDKREPGFYTQEHARLAEAFAAQAAIAVENARLFQSERSARESADTLREVSRVVGSTLELDEVLSLVLRQLERVLTYDTASILLFAGAQLYMTTTIGYEDEKLVRTEATMRLGDSSILQAMSSDHRPVVIPDVREDERWIWVPGAENVRAWVGVPLFVRDEMVGALMIDSNQPGSYTEADAAIAQALANQVAVAIENARLFEAEREQRELGQALEEAAAAVSSTLDINQVLDRILEQVERVVAGDGFNIMLVENETAQIVRWRGYERMGMDDKSSRVAVPITKYPSLLKMMRTGEPTVIPDTASDSDWISSEVQEWRRSYVAAPIRMKNMTVGFLNVNSTQPGQFGPADAQRLQAFADHAAAAIENAQLYQELQNYAERLEERVDERTAQLQAQYAWLEAILQSTTDGIIVTDTRREIVQANPVAQTWLTQTLSPKDADRLRNVVQDIARRAEERPEAMLELKGLDLELKAAPIPEPGGGESAAVVAVHDVSHLKALDRMKTRFVSNVSHELRTPVTTIKLYAALMQRTPVEKWKAYLDALEKEADRQARLVEDILQISRIDAGRMELKPRAVPLNDLTEAAIASHQLLAESKALTLEHRIADPGPVVLVDPERTMQVLNNLVENSIYYTPEGGQVVVSTGREKMEGRIWATVTVADTGLGIPEDELPYVFERFFRGDETRQMQVSGTGLGLAIVNEIVELHGGRVTVKSRVGDGTTFTVSLPLA